MNERALLMVILAAGCGDHGDTVSLATLLRYDVSVSMSNTVDVGPSASLSFGNPWKEPCQYLARNIDAKLDGAAAKTVDPGHADDYDGIYQCTSPSITFALPARMSGANVFSVRDSSATLEVETTDLFAARSIALVAPSTGALGSSQVVTAQWTPGAALMAVTVAFTPAGAAQPAWEVNASSNDSGLITFTTPSYGDSVAGSLAVSASGPTVVARCSGAKSCTAAFYETVTLGVTAGTQ